MQRISGKIFFLLVFTYIWQEIAAKFPKLPEALRNVNPAIIASC